MGKQPHDWPRDIDWLLGLLQEQGIYGGDIQKLKDALANRSPMVPERVDQVVTNHKGEIHLSREENQRLGKLLHALDIRKSLRGGARENAGRKRVLPEDAVDLTTQVPRAVANALDAHRREGQSRADAVREILSAYLGNTADDAAALD